MSQWRTIGACGRQSHGRDNAGSTPLTWEEVEAGEVRPDDWTLRTLPQRVMQLGDLFASVLQGGQSLPV
jgi:DNA primase